MSVVRAVLTIALPGALLAGCGDGGGFPDAVPIDQPPANGTFSLMWSVKDPNGATLDCAEIGAQAVTVITRNKAVQGGSTEVFTCNTLAGTSPGITPGTYDMDFELGGVGGDPQTGIIATSPKQQDIEVPSGNNVPLMPITFTVDATGGIKVNQTVPNTPGGNCGTTANNGAGITGMTLVLQHQGSGTCEPVTFTYAANATLPGGTYTVDCASPVVAPCIEADQQLTATGVPSGNYQLHLRGKIGTSDCFTNDDTLPVYPLGRDVTRTLNFAAAPMGTPGC
jgi:hypothetical protein